MGITLTNKYNLPSTIVSACSHDSHRVAGTCSVSELIDSPRIRILKRRHNYTVDVSERLDSLLGNAIHHILEFANVSSARKRAFLLTIDTIQEQAKNIVYDDKKALQLSKTADWIQSLMIQFFGTDDGDYLTEQTLSKELAAGFTLYGTFDLYHKPTKTILDYKSCSVFKWMYPESRKQWQRQLSVYAWLAMMNDMEVNALKIVPFFKDWSQTEKLRSKDYPASRIMEIPVELNSFERIGEYISKRVAAHISAEHLDDDQLPACTGQEKWSKAMTYAVVEFTKKRAVNGGIFEDVQLAMAYVKENHHKYRNELIIEERPGDDMRCESYCPVKDFCNHYQDKKKFRQA